jgi:hypothetical protein
VRGVDLPQHSPRSSCRKTAPDHTINAKSKLNIAITNNHGVSPQQSADTLLKAEQSELLLQKKRPRNPTNNDSARSKISTTRGVLSNFRGLFTKQKDDIVKEVSTPTPAVREQKITAKPESRKDATGASAVNPTLFSGLQPRTYFVRGDEGTISRPFSGRGDHSQKMTPSCAVSPMPDSPALSDTGRISSLAMEILELARREQNTLKKEKLIRVCHSVL